MNSATLSKPDLIQVSGFGSGETINSYLESCLSHDSDRLILAGITEVVVAFDRTQLKIDYARSEKRTASRIAMEQSVAAQFSSAIDRVENNLQLRPEIKEKLLEEFSRDFAEVLNQISENFKHESEKNITTSSFLSNITETPEYKYGVCLTRLRDLFKTEADVQEWLGSRESGFSKTPMQYMEDGDFDTVETLIGMIENGIPY
jgi:CRP-like cAMP-binding protein